MRKMISGSFRFLIEVESLNGVESVGNLTKHRTAPVVVASNGSYLVRYVPVISGEALAHAYQVALVDLALKNKLPVGKYSSQYEFIKFADDNVVKEEGLNPPKDYTEAKRFEVDVMLKDVVSDVAGFMYAGKYPVRRTSRFKVGYMIPALISEEVPAQLEAQFHVRYSAKVEERQMIYNVETGSALYTLTFELDDDLIAIPSTVGEKVEGEDELLKQQKVRREIAIKALEVLLTGMFGGKRSRFMPSFKVMSGVVTVTDFPFIPEPSHSNSYIEDTTERLEKAKGILGGKVGEAFAVINESGVNAGTAKKVGSVEDLINELLK